MIIFFYIVSIICALGKVLICICPPRTAAARTVPLSIKKCFFYEKRINIVSIHSCCGHDDKEVLPYLDCMFIKGDFATRSLVIVVIGTVDR